MTSKTIVSLLALVAAAITACTVPTYPPDPQTPTSDAGTSDAATFQFPDGAMADAHVAMEAAACDPPDMLIILDRSCSMETMVGTLGTRLAVAESAINFITKAPIDTTLRFGLEVLPDDAATCGGGKLMVPTGIGNGAQITNVLGTLQTSCNTPIGAALQSAATTLASVKVPGRAQYVMLVTDGGEICQTDAQVTAIAQSLEKSGIDIFVVGFGGDDDPVLLNSVACAGHTAANFATDCTCTSAGCTTASSVNSTTTPLYFRAADGPTLQKSLATITNQACCGCSVPVN